MKRSNFPDLLGLAIFSAYVAAIIFGVSFVAGSFLAGAMECRDCETLLDRCFLGALWVPFSLLTWGHVPRDAGGVGIISVWPYVHALWGTASLVQVVATAAVWIRRDRG